jgi:hypothetical protein
MVKEHIAGAAMYFAIGTAHAGAQTHVGSWSLQEAMAAPKAGVYFISSETGDPRGLAYSSVEFYCEKGNYTFNLMPPANPATQRNDLPDGIWQVQISINNQAGVALAGQSDGGMISAPVSRQQMLTLSLTKAREPIPDVLTAMIEKIDGGRIQRAINYPATRFHAAMSMLGEVCENTQ